MVVRSGEKEEVWRDVAEGEAAGLEAGTVVIVQRQPQAAGKEGGSGAEGEGGSGDGSGEVKEERATLVEAGGDGSSWKVRYGDGSGDGDAGKETEDGVSGGRVKRRLVHVWSHTGYSTPEVKEDKGNGTMAVAFARKAEDLKEGDMVQVWKGGYASRGEGEYVPDEDAESHKPPYRVLKWADGRTDWVLLDDLALGGEWGGERREI